MIRRKLTRIEVTLDDTKELDDLFIKNSQPSNSQTTAAAAATTTAVVGSANLTSVSAVSGLDTSSISKLKNNIYQKQLSLKEYVTIDQAANSDSTSPPPLIGATSTTPTRPLIDPASNNIASNTDLAHTDAGTTNIANSSESLPLNFNPQPYTPSSRFQLSQNPQ